MRAAGTAIPRWPGRSRSVICSSTTARFAFVMTAFYMGTAARTTLATGISPRWAGWPRVAERGPLRARDSNDVCRTKPIPRASTTPGAGEAVLIANFPPLLWFLVVGVILVRRSSALTLGGAQRE